MNVRFVVVAPESKQGTFTVRLPIIVGRSEEAKFRIQQDRVSRKHCEFFEKEGGLFIRDLGSTNGTFLNDEQIPSSTKTPVASGAVVRVGSLAFRVEYGAADAADASGRSTSRRSAADATVQLRHAADSERLQVEHVEQHKEEVAAAASEGGEMSSAEFMAEEPAAEPAELEPAELEPAELEPAELEPAELEPAAPEPTETAQAFAPEQTDDGQPDAEQASPKPGSSGGFDFLAVGTAAASDGEESPQWPAADADAVQEPADDDKLGDFFKGLK